MEKLEVSQALNTIEQAIQEARKVPSGNYFYDILWGSILSIYYIVNYISISFPGSIVSSFDNFFWIVFPLGGIISALRSKQDDKSETAKSLIDKVYLFAYSGFALAYITIYLASEFYGLCQIVIPVFCSLLGLTVFVTGGIVKETLSIIVGILAMLIGAYILKLNEAEQCLYASFVCVVTCIMPGIKMKFSRV
ncbi:MAG: hypothetical protein ACKOX3_00185 [Bacteroidota bacterium]